MAIKSIQEILAQHRSKLLSVKGLSGKTLPFEKGEILKGQVLESDSSRYAKLLIKGEEVTARTSVLLKKGQTAFFKVEQTSPQNVLKILETAGEASLKSSSHLTKVSPYKLIAELISSSGQDSLGQNVSGNIPGIPEQLLNIFNNIAIKPDDFFSSSLLMSFIHRSGLLWENKLKSMLKSGVPSKDKLESFINQDFKGLSLKLLQSLGEDESIKSNMLKILDSLEQLQILNKTAFEESSRLLFMLPLQFHEKVDYGQLFVDLSGKRKSGNKDGVLKVCLFLRMSNLGPVRADAMIFKRTIKVDFWLTNEKVKSLVNENANLLKTQLERHGFYLQGITCYLEEHETLNETSFAEKMIAKDHTFEVFI